MTQKVLLRKYPPHPFPPADANSLQWKASLPFFVNHRGMLVHRVRSVRSHYTSDGRHRHDSVHYWCDAFCNTHSTDGFIGDPPKDRLLCARCELIAASKGQKPASELAGRHVCIGQVKVKRLCCLGTEN